MKFSVIIPALNEEEFVHNTIEALQNQTLPREHYEIIVVDNGSEDKTSEVAKRAGADKVVKELKKGTNMARQKGIDVSQGRILAFIDADSTAPKHWLERMETLLEERQAVCISGPCLFGHPFADFVAKYVYYLAAKTIPLITRKRGGIILGSNFAVYRSAIDKIGGLPQLEFYGDDTAIAVLLARRAGKIVYTPRVRIASSPRRFNDTGTIRLGARYIKHYFKIYFSKDYQ